MLLDECCWTNVRNQRMEGIRSWRSRRPLEVDRRTAGQNVQLLARSISRSHTLWQKRIRSSQVHAKRQKHTTGGIPRWSPTLVLVARFSAYVWQSGRDAQFSLTYGRMCLFVWLFGLCSEIPWMVATSIVVVEVTVRRHPSFSKD